MKTHSSSKAHVDACIVYNRWKKNKTIDKQNEEEVERKENFWRTVLKRLFDITLTLASNGLPFRGQTEDSYTSFGSDFLMMVQIIARYDDVLKQIMNVPEGSTKYSSPTIQNKMIECLGEELYQILISGINASPFFCCMFDTTQDMTKKDQDMFIFIE